MKRMLGVMMLWAACGLLARGEDNAVRPLLDRLTAPEAKKEYRAIAIKLADVADIPSADLLAGGDKNKRYFLIGPRAGAPAPPEGYKLAIVMPGGDGGAAFNPFVRRILKNALGPEWIVAEPVAFKWHARQQVVWPTAKNPALGQKFSTEEFVEAVVADVKGRQKVNPSCIVTLSWSSGGPAAYAISLAKKKAVTGSYIAMSVFRTEWLPPLAGAQGHKYFIDHSPQDKVCPYAMAQTAIEELKKNGARVEAVTYEGGHGWRGNVFGRIRKGMAWLSER